MSHQTLRSALEKLQPEQRHIYAEPDTTGRFNALSKVWLLSHPEKADRLLTAEFFAVDEVALMFMESQIDKAWQDFTSKERRAAINMLISQVNSRLRVAKER